MTMNFRWMLAGGAALLGGCMMSVYPPVPPQPAPPLAEAVPECSAVATPASVAEASAALNAQERGLGALLERDPGQRHARRLTFNPTLARVARRRALDMAARGYFSHTDPDGFGANYHVARAGYRLPAFYSQPPAGNNIESLGRGAATAEQAWRMWMGSTEHRTHLLGLNEMFRDQSEYGIGYAYSPARGEHYWAVLIAKPNC